MKRFITIILFCIISVSAFAQAQIITKREKVKDFPTRITKVVLTGNEFKDQVLKEAVKNVWTISAFEFCDLNDFSILKTDPRFYFLLITDVMTKKETKPGIAVLTLIKGETGVRNINDMLELASIPVCAADSPSGKEMAMMPALLDIMQNYVSKALTSGFSSIRSIRGKLKDIYDYDIIFDKEDLSPQISDRFIAEKFDRQMFIADEAAVVDAMLEGREDTAVGYVVCPSEPQPGSLCYVMIIDAGTYELYYYKKHIVSKNTNTGFLKSDINKITYSRRVKR